MSRLLVIFFALGIFVSCSRDKKEPPTPDIIPDTIDGTITELNLTPLNITTPGKGEFFVDANNTRYKVDFTASAEPAANAYLSFETDTILIDESREFANLGEDAIAYNPVAPNKVTIFFKDGKKVTGFFSLYTSFGGVFGKAIISQWRVPADPTKPTQKAKDDIIQLVERYSDQDGAGPETTPQYLFVKVSKL